ncbi:ABC transporter substrate-binding protein [Ruminiclostridium cellulolyticum]|uniref:Extracellular solute-binding protein family 1 n=1 Tax=Ruminiclostridium cellulolyticum (strain ATCC 35319 / DSM 5812 / JCM 6584 / H10) TaxID=394503 RepID=B8I8N1_RUMCH|nr:ABC transporter substrate-binding protein [Ruminiclostridium cellulolyticum]ACL75264.1 extracellular solute-binding protein family 1 [Ruminiclostridium cellulolyticum H10]
MKKIISRVLMMAATLSVSFALTGCGGASNDKITLKVFNWGDYIGEEVIQKFEDKYNINVQYSIFTTNEDMYVKMKAGGGDYDVVIPSDYMIKKMINEGMVKKIDLNNIPNYKYIDDKFKNLSFDPNNEYSVPYMWGTVGIIYNKTMVKEPVDSWNILWDKKYDKQIFMLDSLRDSIGVTLKKLGYSLNTKNKDELERAKNELIKQKDIVQAYVGDEVKDKMIMDEGAMAVVWSGDAVYMKSQNKDLEYVIPKEGSNLWFDSMVIPSNAKHQKEAEDFINFMCETEIALENTNYIGYSTPQTEAKKKVAPALLKDITAYPTDEQIKNCEVFIDLDASIKDYDKIWTEITSR